MRKKLLATLLVLIMVVSIVPLAASAEVVSNGSCGDNLTWEMDSDGTFTISGTGAMDTFVINRNDSIKKIVIEEGVTTIGAYAFMDCTGLTSVTIPSSVTSIGDSAFVRCTSLTNVSIANGVTSIGSYAFSDCTSLTSVTIPDSVTTIANAAFSGCTNLTSIIIGNGITTINLSTFSGCTALTSLTIGNGVTTIDTSAFSGCTGLTSVTIPGSVTSIGTRAFSGCTGLTSVSIPSSVTSINPNVFEDCSSLTAIEVDSGNTSYCSQNGVLFTKDMTELVTFPVGKTGVYAIPNSVTKISSAAFSGCIGLTGIVIREGVTMIGRTAFSDCTSLTSITFEGSAPGFGDEYAFSGVTATVYYPADNETWTEDVMQDYGGTITWVACSDPEPTVDTGEVTTNTSGTVSSSITVDTSALLTEDDAMLIIEGYDVEIVLSVDEVTSSVSSADSALILSAAGDNVTAVSYLDIDLTKMIYDTEGKVWDQEALTDLDTTVTVTVAIPQSLLDAVETATGTYSVVRVHDGVATVLATSYDSTAQTVTFATDRFSTYGIVFTGSTSTNNTNTGLDDVPQTGDGSLILVGIALMMAAAPVVKKFVF